MPLKAGHCPPCSLPHQVFIPRHQPPISGHHHQEHSELVRQLKAGSHYDWICSQALYQLSYRGGLKILPETIVLIINHFIRNYCADFLYFFPFTLPQYTINAEEYYMGRNAQNWLVAQLPGLISFTSKIKKITLPSMFWSCMRFFFTFLKCFLR